MKLRQILSPYLNRLRLESLIRAVFAALAGGLIAAVLTMIGMWVIDMPYNFTWVLIVTGAAAGVILIVCYFLVFSTSYRNAVRRIDAAGLEARLTTMRELRKDNSVMAQRQREDTLKHLKELKLNAVTLHLPHITATVAAVAVLTAGLLFIVPLRSHAMAGDPYVEDPYEEKYDILEQLKEDIYLKAEGNPALEEFLKNLDEILDRNPDGSGVTDYETIEKLEDLKEQIEQKLEENRVSKIIGQAYIDYVTAGSEIYGFSDSELEARPAWVKTATNFFQKFGNALISRMETSVNSALETLRKDIDNCSKEERDMYTDFIVYHMNQVLNTVPEFATKSELPIAIYGLTDDLNLAAGTPLLSEPYDAAIKTGKHEINKALRLEIEREEAMKEILEKIEETIKDLLPEGTPEDPKDPFEEPEKDPTGELKPEDNPNNKEENENPDNQDPNQKPEDENQSGDQQKPNEEKPNENQNQHQNQNQNQTNGPQLPEPGTNDGLEDEEDRGELGTIVDPLTGEVVPMTKENLQIYMDRMNDRLIYDKSLTEEQKEQIKQYYEYMAGILGSWDDNNGNSSTTNPDNGSNP